MRSVFRLDGAREFRSRWIRLEFSQSFQGQPVRPRLYLHRGAEGAQEHVLPAAVLGRARWLGLAPGDLDAIEISVVDDGASPIRIDGLRAMSELEIATSIAMRRPKAIPGYLSGRLFGGRDRSVLVRSALDLASIDDFAGFARPRRRALELENLDRDLASALAQAPFLSFVIAAGAQDAAALRRTLESLAGQIDRQFRIQLAIPCAVDGREVSNTIERLGLENSVELTEAGAQLGFAQAALALARESSSDWVGWLKAGDVLEPEAVLLFRAFMSAHPKAEILYSDSLAEESGTERCRPELKPDWSPAFLEQVDYAGRPCLFRSSILREVATSVAAGDEHPWWTVLRLAGRSRGPTQILHLKRLLLRHPPAVDACARVPARTRIGHRAHRSTIIIPTRDRVDLLRRAVSSILTHAEPSDDVEILIVDNGSEEPETLAYLNAVQDGEKVGVLPHPGPFNYSDLVNSGAEAARGDVLILLNNDCEARHRGWIGEMNRLAAEPEVGAVGAVLLYADGRLQHAGVALGPGGEAGHRDRKLPPNHPGNLGRLKTVHEVSAVTAACLAVERRKYLEIGGFDRAFAVAFNDIDFCLRLRSHGYRNLLTPQAVLTHAESASRGQDSGPKRARFEAEARLFRERWLPLIHDDPFFHPLFSTTRFSDLLG